MYSKWEIGFSELLLSWVLSVYYKISNIPTPFVVDFLKMKNRMGIGTQLGECSIKVQMRMKSENL